MGILYAAASYLHETQTITYRIKQRTDYNHLNTLLLITVMRNDVFKNILYKNQAYREQEAGSSLKIKFNLTT